MTTTDNHLNLADVGTRCQYGYAPIQHPRYCQCAQVPAAKRDGIGRANTNADPDMKARVDAAIHRLARSGREFSANDMRVELAGIAGPVIGGRFSAAHKAGLIVPTGDRVVSNLASTNGHELKVWRAAA